MLKMIFMSIIMTSFLLAGDAGELLKNVKERYSNIKDFSADIKQEGKNPVFTGKLYYKQDNQFHIELKNMTIISDGSTIWNYNKKDKRVVIDDVEYSGSFPFSIETLLNEYPSKSNLVSSTDGNLNLLILTPKPGSDLNFTKATIWINSDNLIERISVGRGQEGEITIRISDYKINLNLPQSRFTFTAPEGSNIIDLR
jgi:outer membrane lipoprotein-sorting protein